MKGEIALRSELQKGTSVKFLIPTKYYQGVRFLQREDDTDVQMVTERHPQRVLVE